jgi:hypothetical protein
LLGRWQFLEPLVPGQNERLCFGKLVLACQ